MHVLWSSAHADDNSGPGGLLLEEIPGILNIGADREPVAGEITVASHTLANSRSVEFVGDELSVPSQQRIRLREAANSSKAFRPSR